VSVDLKMQDDPLRLVSSISMSNLSETDIILDSLRIGLMWTPPQSWWKYWSYWRLLKLQADVQPMDDAGRDTGMKFSSLADKLSNAEPPTEGTPIAADESGDAVGWIISDEKRFLLMMSEPAEQAQVFHLDFVRRRGSTGFIMGGLSCGTETQIGAGQAITGTEVSFVPGKGGWPEAFANAAALHG